MKTLTEMKKVCCLGRFVLLVMALGLASTFSSCSSDDDESIPVYSIKDVEGTYSGKMQTTKPGPYSSICAITSFRASALFFSSATSSLFIRI